MSQKEPVIEVSPPYTTGVYQWHEQVVDVTVSIPDYGQFKQTIVYSEATPEKLEKLRVDGGAEIRRVIEKYSTTLRQPSEEKKIATA